MSARTASPLSLRPADQHAVARYLLSLPGSEIDSTRASSASKNRTPNAELVVDQPGGGEVAYQISITDAAKDTVHALIGTFMYDDATCTIIARSDDGEEIWIRGSITKCHFIAGRIHHIRIELESPVDVGTIIDL